MSKVRSNNFNFNTFVITAGTIVVAALQNCNHKETMTKVQDNADAAKKEQYQARKTADSAFKSQNTIMLDSIAKMLSRHTHH